jgi:uncharacterized Zn finger protein (UPF0148 family)
MQLERPLRLPLATGASPVNLALGVGVFGFLGAAPLFIGSLLHDLLMIPCVLLIAIWFMALLRLPFVGRKQRASDIVLDVGGVTILCGPHAGQRLGWKELAQHPPVVHARTDSDEVRLALAGSIELITSEPDELTSSKNLAQTLTTLARGHQAAQQGARQHGDSVAIPHCANCGAPVAPSEAESVNCSHCGVEAKIPERLQREVGHLRRLVEARTLTTRALSVLSRWPRAHRVNLVLGVAVIPLTLGWPVSASITSEFFQYRDVFSWRDVGVMFMSTAVLTLGLVFWLAGQVVHRQAFGLVVAAFHAVKTSEDGLVCRNCGAPLAVRPDTPLVVCAFCRCDNVVLGLELPARVDAEEGQATSLDKVLRERLRSMRTWRILSATSAALVVVGGLMLAEPLHRAAVSPAPPHPLIDRDWSYPGPAR